MTDIPTVTVLGSQAFEQDDGSVAIVLTVQGRGPIAFEVNRQTIGLIRAELDRVEELLRS